MLDAAAPGVSREAPTTRHVHLRRLALHHINTGIYAGAAATRRDCRLQTAVRSGYQGNRHRRLRQVRLRKHTAADVGACLQHAGWSTQVASVCAPEGADGERRSLSIWPAVIREGGVGQQSSGCRQWRDWLGQEHAGACSCIFLQTRVFLLLII